MSLVTSSVMYGSGPGKVDLHGTLKRLAYSRIDLSLLQRQSTSQEKHGRLRTTRHFPASVYGDRGLSMRLVLVSFTLIYSCMCIIIPQTQNHLTGYQSTKG